MKSKIRIAMISLAPLLLSTAGCATVNPGERGLLYRAFSPGTPPLELLPGTHAKAPWNNVVRYDLRWRTAKEKTEVQTKDKLHLTVPSVVAYRPKANRLAEIHSTLGPDFYESTVRPAVVTAVRTEFAHRIHVEVVPKAAELQAHVLDDLRRKVAPYNIEIQSVTFEDLDYPPALAKAILDQMTVQQQIKNRAFDLTLVRRDQEIASARLKGKAETRLAAKDTEAAIAAKDVEILLTRSKAEAEAVRIRTTKVSPHYLKLRAIEAQESLARSPNAKLYFIPVGKDGIPVALHPEALR